MILSAFFFAASSLSIKKLARTDSSRTTLLYLTLFMTLLTVGPATLGWQPLSLEAWLKIAGIGILYMMTQGGLVEAYTHAAASFIAPFKLCRCPMNILAGILLFGEVPPVRTWAGGLLIVGAYAILMGGSLQQLLRKWRAREESNS